jgi:uncharacterized protein YbaP (TraB family)
MKPAWPVGACLAFVLTTFGATSPAHAEPAIWVVKGEHATIYLFGTIHILKPALKWRSPKVNAAFAASRELWVESEAHDDPQGLRALWREFGGDWSHPLFTRLSKADLTRVDEAAWAVHIKGGEDSLDMLRPWVAAGIIDGMALERAGYDAKSGVESVLEAEARAANKPLHGIETPEEHFRVLADLSHKAEADMLRQAVQDVTDGTGKVDAVVDAWMHGDVDAIAKDSEDMREKSPEVYQALLPRRNEHFADAIAQRLNGTGTVFVAVGSAHLAGAESVQVDLQRRGITAERE